MMPKIIMANWKMQLSVAQSERLALDLKMGLNKLAGSQIDKLTIVLAPDFSSLGAVSKIIKKTALNLGAQNSAMEERGAWTGEVSPQNLQELGVKYVLIGHSERRRFMGETDQMVNAKLKAVLAQKDIIPLICIGEVKKTKQLAPLFKKQLTAAWKDIKLSLNQKIIIAYEPAWALSTSPGGQAQTAAEIVKAHSEIKKVLLTLFTPAQVKNNFQIIYGGSVNEENIANFIDLENVSGVLIGGASLKAPRFIQIIKQYLSL